jgi:hypothetical protein
MIDLYSFLMRDFFLEGFRANGTSISDSVYLIWWNIEIGDIWAD